MKNNRLKGLFAISLCIGMVLSGCSKENVNETAPTGLGNSWEPIPTDEVVEEEIEEVVEEEEEEIIEEEVVEGCYRSELTNEWIDENLMNQRPIAVMIDNEIKALNHYGVNSCDIVYEIMNSTANDRITRLMCIAKDYENIERLGSVRSTRPTNFMLSGEYDAILIHDGGPFYNEAYYGKDYVDNLSGGFARFSNGKSLEFTEYVTPETYTNDTKGKTYDGLLKRIEDAGYSRTYTEHYQGQHFAFSNTDYKLSEKYESGVQSATNVDLSGAFRHNKSMLKYNAETNSYDYYEYDREHVDELDGGKITSFKNAIIYSCSFNQLDENGYLIYNVIGSGMDGYYLTNGEAIPIYWSKTTENGITEYKSVVTQEDIVLNTGKTYIAVIPEDTWSKITVVDSVAGDEDNEDAGEDTPEGVDSVENAG